MSIRTDRIRVLVLFKRSAGVSREEFSKKWLEVHGPLMLKSKLFTDNILKYEQLHITDAATKLGMPDNEWDGVAVFEALSFENVVKVLTSEEFVSGPTGEVSGSFMSRDPKDCLILPTNVAAFLDN